MKKLLILTAISTTVSLSRTCLETNSIGDLGADSIIDKTFYTAMTRGRTDSLILACALGYNYTDNTKISIGPIVSLPIRKPTIWRIGVMTGLSYRYNIKDMSVAPYVNANLGVITYSPHIINELPENVPGYNFVYRISPGVDFLFSCSGKSSFHIGYVLERGIWSLDPSHGLEMGVNFQF